jgi:L-ascorbate metabolism protein UlaG (beta-lactamase superfamily)
LATQVRITFVGNEGVLVEAGAGAGTGAILVDALFGDGIPAYTTTPRAVIDAIERARTPFDNIRVALATHFHPDHFNAHSATRFLRSSPRSAFVSTPQSCQRLEERMAQGDSLATRVHALSPAEGEMTTLSFSGITVGAFGLSHGKVNYGDVEHVGFLVDLDGVTVLHLGDGIIAKRSLAAAGVLDRTVDVAFLPFWYLTYPFGQKLMREGFRAPGAAGRGDRAVRPARRADGRADGGIRPRFLVICCK